MLNGQDGPTEFLFFEIVTKEFGLTVIGNEKKLQADAKSAE